jgi:excisionase family DNA binding protein
MTQLTDGPSMTSHRVTPRLVGTIRDTAKQLGVTELTVRRQIKSGKLHAVQIGSSWRIPSSTNERIQELPEECTLHQVANSLDVSDLTVRRWIKNGQLPAMKRNRAWIVLRSDLERLLTAGTPRTSVASQVTAHQLGTTHQLHTHFAAEHG